MKREVLLLHYLRGKWKLIVTFLLFSIVFAVVFWLYKLPVEAVGYACLLCMVLGIFLFLISFLRFRRRHRTLKALRTSIGVSVSELPEPHNVIEQDYTELLEQLFSAKRTELLAAETSLQDMMDYYTLWAHQIKTPIAAMRLLLQSSESDVAHLSAELFKIEQYVEMVLSYLRLESESSDYVLRETDLDEVVRGCVRKYARLFILSRLAFTFQETHLTVLTDEKWLAFVIEQLLSNALKYTKQGRISIYAAGTKLVIEDTGIGIRPEDLPRVFDKGFTGYNGREDKKSTGIGLYLCRRVMQKLGHTLNLESGLGTGTRAILSLESVDITHE